MYLRKDGRIENVFKHFATDAGKHLTKWGLVNKGAVWYTVSFSDQGGIPDALFESIFVSK